MIKIISCWCWFTVPNYILYYQYISGHQKRRTRYHETLKKCKAALRDAEDRSHNSGFTTFGIMALWTIKTVVLVLPCVWKSFDIFSWNWNFTEMKSPVSLYAKDKNHNSDFTTFGIMVHQTLKIVVLFISCVCHVTWKHLRCFHDTLQKCKAP